MKHIWKYQPMGFKTGQTLCGKRVSEKVLVSEHSGCLECDQVDQENKMALTKFQEQIKAGISVNKITLNP